MEEQEEAVERAKMDIVTLKRQDEDLDILFKRIYEDSVTEQKELRKKTGELQYLIDNEKQEIYDFNLFLKNVRKYTNPEELSTEMLNDLIDKILVHGPDRSRGQPRIVVILIPPNSGELNHFKIFVVCSSKIDI